MFGKLEFCCHRGWQPFNTNISHFFRNEWTLSEKRAFKRILCKQKNISNVVLPQFSLFSKVFHWEYNKYGSYNISLSKYIFLIFIRLRDIFGMKREKSTKQEQRMNTKWRLCYTWSNILYPDELPYRVSYDSLYLSFYIIW